MFIVIAKALAAALAVYMVGSELYNNKRNFPFIWSVWKRFRFGMFLEVIGLIVFVFFAIFFLNHYVPFLRCGWMNLISSSGGNIIITPVVGYSTSSHVILRIFPPVFLIFLLLAVPYMANFEERVFRKGRHSLKEIAIGSIGFGLVHLVAGIPLSAAFTLILPGFFLAYKYERKYREWRQFTGAGEASREAVLYTTAYHTMFNSLLISYLILLTILCV